MNKRNRVFWVRLILRALMVVLVFGHVRIVYERLLRPLPERIGPQQAIERGVGAIRAFLEQRPVLMRMNRFPLDEVLVTEYPLCRSASVVATENGKDLFRAEFTISPSGKILEPDEWTRGKSYQPGDAKP